jgi:predicted DNA-binding transcriptional regulator YafY
MFSRFSEEELQKIKEAADLLGQYKFSDVFGDVSGALQKILDFIEIHSATGEGSVVEFVDPEGQPHIKGSEHLPIIIKAIQDQKALRLYYHPFYEDKPYFTDVHPYLLKEYRNRWYLIGLNDFKEQIRTYALDRIQDIQPSGARYIPGAFNASEYFRNSIGIISPEGSPPKTLLAIQKTQAQYLISQPWHKSQNIEEETGEEIIFSFRVHPTYEFLSLVLSLGKDVRILEPGSLVERMKKELREMLEKLG